MGNLLENASVTSKCPRKKFCCSIAVGSLSFPLATGMSGGDVYKSTSHEVMFEKRRLVCITRVVGSCSYVYSHIKRLCSHTNVNTCSSYM